MTLRVLDAQGRPVAPGKMGAAFVVARDPGDPEFASAKLPLALRPRTVEVLAELPKSVAGKVQRIRLH